MKNTVLNFGVSTILRIKNNSRYQAFHISGLLFFMHGAFKFKLHCDSQLKPGIARGRTPLRMSVSVHFVTAGEGTVWAHCDQCLSGRGASYHPENCGTVE